MAVTGIVHPERDPPERRARAPGDVLLLTKPLGSGIVTTAIKRGDRRRGARRSRRSRSCRRSTAPRARSLAASGAVHALTDVTGFGLLGHAWEMAEGSGVALRLRAEAIPVLPGVRDLAAQDVVPGGSRANLALGRAERARRGRASTPRPPSSSPTRRRTAGSSRRWTAPAPAASSRGARARRASRRSRSARWSRVSPRIEVLGPASGPPSARSARIRGDARRDRRRAPPRRRAARARVRRGGGSRATAGIRRGALARGRRGRRTSRSRSPAASPRGCAPSARR